MTRTTRRAYAALAGILAAFAVITTAAAHDVHPFGKVKLALGWLHEPAYVGFDNAVQVLVKDGQDKPITSITDKDLVVEVSLGAQKMDAQPLKPTSDPDTGLGTPGEYQMHFIPTAPGNYTFHLKGSVTGQAIDETVTASPSTFDEVTDDSAVEFPNKVPAVGDLATKVDRDTTRIQDAQAAAANAAGAASSGKDRANQALALGIVALIVGVVLGGAGLTVGALARRRAKV